MDKDNEIFERLGRIDGNLDEIKNIVMRTEERNNKEHDEIRAEIALRALKVDVDNLGATLRKHDYRLSTIEEKPDKDLASKTRGALKWFGVIIGAAVLGAILTKFPDILKLLLNR